jgi:hypothetical protein
LTESAGVVTQDRTGTFAQNFVEYRYGGGQGFAFASLRNMVNPDQRIAFSSVNSTFTVTTSANCIVAVLNGGSSASGSAHASIAEEKPPLFLEGRTIQTGGKTMKSGDFIEACSF